MRARDNPFRTSRLEMLAFRHPRLDAAARRLALVASGGRGAIVGPHGSGKTTLLRELATALDEDGTRVVHWFVSEDVPPPRLTRLLRSARRLGPTDALLIDGAGHLGAITWRLVRRAARRAGVFVVTSHAAGRLPTWVETASDPRLLVELTRELADDPLWPPESLLDELFARHDGNLREVFLALYDLVSAEASQCADSARRSSLPVAVCGRLSQAANPIGRS